MRALKGTAIACLLPLAALAGCGGGQRQDANEPSGDYALSVTRASFPARQSLAEPTVMAITVRNNEATRTAPNVAVTVDSFSRVSEQAGLADPRRPVWIVDRPPLGGDTAYVNTWALGPLGPGQTKTFTWRVTAIQSGQHQVAYRVSPGLAGKARLAAGSKAAGNFTVNVSSRPAQARVDPVTGAVVTK